MRMLIKCPACLRNSHNEIEVPPGTVPQCQYCGKRIEVKEPPKTLFKPNDLPLFRKRDTDEIQS